MQGLPFLRRVDIPSDPHWSTQEYPYQQIIAHASDSTTPFGLGFTVNHIPLGDLANERKGQKILMDQLDLVIFLEMPNRPWSGFLDVQIVYCLNGISPGGQPPYMFNEPNKNGIKELFHTRIPVGGFNYPNKPDPGTGTLYGDFLSGGAPGYTFGWSLPLGGRVARYNGPSDIDIVSGQIIMVAYAVYPNGVSVDPGEPLATNTPTMHLETRLRYRS